MSIEGGNFNMYLNLKLPGTEGQPYVIPGMTSPNEGGSAAAAATLAQHLGYSDKDTIGSALDEVIELAKQLNIALLNEMGSDQAILNYLNTLDPTMPNLPPIKAFLVIAERALQQGKIAGFQISMRDDATDSKEKTEAYREMLENDQTKTTVTRKQSGADSSTASTSASKDEAEDNRDQKDADTTSGIRKTSYEGFEKNEGYGLGALNDNFQGHIGTQDEISGDITKQIEAGRANIEGADTVDPRISLGNIDKASGNAWLVGNVFVVFLMEFMDLQRVLMQNKVVQGTIELAGMNLVVELAKTTADIIMNIAHMNQMIHIVTAVMSGVAIGMSVGGIAYGSNSFREFAGSKIAQARGLPHVVGSSSSVHAFDRGSIIGQMGASLEKLATSATQAATDLSIALQEGLKEILQAYRQIAQHQLDKAGEATRTSEEQIQQLLQTLEKIRDGLQQAIANALR